MANLDLSANYLMTNSALRSYLVIASTSQNSSLVIETSSSSSNQLWYMTSANDSNFYRIHTVQKGRNNALNVANYIGLPPQSLSFEGVREENSGQLWRLDKWEDGSWKLSNKLAGDDKHLDTPARGLPKLSGGDTPGQHWTLQKPSTTVISRNAASTDTVSTNTFSTSPYLGISLTINFAYGTPTSTAPSKSNSTNVSTPTSRDGSASSLPSSSSSGVSSSSPTGTPNADTKSTNCEANTTTCAAAAKRHSLSAGGRVGIAFGVILFVAVLAVGAYVLYIRRQKRPRKGQTPPDHL